MKEIIEQNPWIAVIASAILGGAGVGVGGDAAGIWQGQYAEARQDLESCREALDDQRDALRVCTRELIRYNPRAGLLLQQEAAPPAVAAPPPE